MCLTEQGYYQSAAQDYPLSFESACYIAAIQNRLNTPQAHKLIKWAKELEYYEPIMLDDASMVLMPELTQELLYFIEMIHAAHGTPHRMYLYRAALSLITYNCTIQIQQEILSWIQKQLQKWKDSTGFQVL